MSVLSVGDREAAARQLDHWLRMAPEDAEALQLRDELAAAAAPPD